MEVSEVEEVKHLRDEDARLKELVADHRLLHGGWRQEVCALFRKDIRSNPFKTGMKCSGRGYLSPGSGLSNYECETKE